MPLNTMTSLSSDWTDPLSAPVSTEVLGEDPLAKDPLREDTTPTKRKTGVDAPPVDGVNLARAEDVLEKSNNNKNDAVWAKMNGGETSLTLDDQPDAWKLGIQVKGIDTTGDGVYDQYTVTGGEDVGITTIEEYRAMLKRDFNFSKTISRFIAKADGNAKAAGKLFTDAILVRYELDGDDADAAQKAKVTSLAQNIWSYATTGADTKGNTDIAQMQGMLFALDSELVKVSNSNTKMSKDAFTIPGSDGESIQEGDGLHGRATILTTRHIIDNLTDDPDDNEYAGYDHTILLADISGSMDPHRKNFSQMINAGNLTGDVSIATYYDDDLSLQYEKTTRSMLPEIQQQKTDLYAKRKALRDNGDQDSAEYTQLSEQLTELLALEKQLLQTPKKMTRKQAAGDLSRSTGSSRDQKYRTNSDPNQNEEGMRNALKLLKTYPVPEVPPEPPYQNQLIILTNENDADATALTELQELARALGFDIKVMFVQNGEVTTIDIMELTVSDYKKHHTQSMEWWRLKNDSNTREWSDYTD